MIFGSWRKAQSGESALQADSANERSGSVVAGQRVETTAQSISGSSEATFDLFVSYATEPDHRLVRELESFLESFHKLPTANQVALRPINVCVDSSDFASRHSRGTETSVLKQVPEAIQESLSKASELLVLCSPAACHSSWVDLEIKWFLENRGPGSIRLAVTEGADPDTHPLEVFPSRIVDAGLHKGLWYDFRGFHRNKSAHWLKVRDYDDARTRLAADVLEVPAGTIQPIWFREQQRRARRKRDIAIAVSMMMTLLAGIATHEWFEARRQRDSAVARELEARENLAVAFEERGDRAWQSHEIPAARLLYAKAISLSDNLTRRMKEISSRLWGARLVWQTPSLTLGHSISTLSDGSIAVGNVDGTVHIWKLDDMTRVASFPSAGTRLGVMTISASPHRRPVAVAATSPNGAWLASADDEGTILVWNRTSAERHLELHVGDTPLRALVISDSGERVVSLDTNGVLTYWDATSGEAAIRLDGVRDFVATTTRIGSATDFLTLTVDGKLSVRRLEDSTIQQTVDVGGRKVAALALSKFQRRNYALSTNGMLMELNIESGRSHDLVELPVRDAAALSISDDGLVAVTVDRSGGATVWSVKHGTQQFVSPPLKGPAVRPTISEDGTRMALLRDGRLEVWDTRTGHRIGAATGHQAKITAIAFAPNDGRLVSASEDGTVRLWDSTRRTSDLLPTVHSGGVSTLAFDPQGRRFATGGKDGLVVMWDLGSLDSPRKLTTMQTSVVSLAFGLEGEWLAIAQERGSARAVRLTDEEHALDLGPAVSVAFSPDGAAVALGGRDRITLQAFPEGSTGKTFRLEGIATHVTFDKAGEFVLAASIYGARAWYLGTGQPMKRITDAGLTAPIALDESGILIGEDNANIVLHSLASAWPAKLMSLPTSGSGANALAVDSAQHLLAVATGSSISFWSLHRALEEAELRVGQAPVQYVAFSPDGSNLATLELVENEHQMKTRLRLFDAASQAQWLVYPKGQEQTLVISPGARYTVAFDRETRRLAWGATADHIYLLASAKNGRSDQRLGVEAGALDGWDIGASGVGNVNALAFSPDGSTLAFAGTSRFIHLWNVISNSELGRGLEVRPESETGKLMITQALVGGLAFSADGTVLAATERDSGAVSLWNLKSQTRISTLPAGLKRDSQEVIALPDIGFVIADGDAKTATVWDGQGNRRLSTLRFTHDVDALSLSADGRRLLVSGTKGFTVWDFARSMPVTTFLPQNTSIGRAALSPDGRQVAMVDWQLGRVRIWQVAALERYAAQSAALIFSTAQQDSGYVLQGLSPTVALHPSLRPDAESIGSPVQQSRPQGK